MDTRIACTTFRREISAGYPQLRELPRGSSTGADPVYPRRAGLQLTLTSQGDNWANYPSQAACGSCHDAVDFSKHAGGQTDDSKCASCHSTGGAAGSIQQSHTILTDEARKAFAAQIISVSNTAPGQFPKCSTRYSIRPMTICLTT